MHHRLTRRRWLAGTCALGLMPRAQATPGRLTLTGSSTIPPLALEIGKRFEQLNPGLRVEVQAGGSSRGVADVRTGAAQLGLVSRALKPDERDLVAHTIALDGIGLIVHRGNPVASLSRAQVQAIYTGRVRHWRELGGPDRPISVVHKAEGRSTLELFLQHFQLSNSQIQAQVVIGDNQQGIKTVAGNLGAIGYVSIGSADVEARLGAAIRLLPMAGVAARVAHVRDGTFPLSRPLNLVSRGEPAALAQRFIDFAQSRAVRDLVEAQYFVQVGAP